MRHDHQGIMVLGKGMMECVGSYIWESWHIFAFHFPSHPNDEQVKAALDYSYSIPKLLPCPICRPHAQKLLEQTPLTEDILKNGGFGQWTVDIHNQVNKRIGKSHFTYDQAMKKYLIPCQESGKKKNDQNITFILIVVIIIAALIAFLIMKKK